MSQNISVRQARGLDVRIIEMAEAIENNFIQSLKPISGENLQSFGGGGTLGDQDPGTSSPFGTFLKVAGDVMLGPISFDPQTAVLADDVLDIGPLTAKYKGHIIVSPQSGTSDTLAFIKNAQHAGQRLTIQGIVGNTISIPNDASGNGSAGFNIRTPTGSTVTLTGTQSLDLYFDAVANQWAFVDSAFFANITGTGDNLGNHTATQTLNMNGNSISNINDLIFSTAGINILHDSANLQFLVGLGQQIRAFVNGIEKIGIGGTQIDIYQQMDFNNNEIVDLRKLTFIDSHAIERVSSGLDYQVFSPATRHRFYRNTQLILDINNIALDVWNNTLVHNNDIQQIQALRFNTSGKVINDGATSSLELAYQVGSGQRHSFFVAAARYFDVLFENSAKVLKMDSTALIDFNNTSTSATGGTRTIPSLALGFITVRVGGTNVKIPYFAP